ncbi:MAG: BtpA/SgcQ family protein [Candidatus Eisenbacteria bacterium]|nr:BtpA/SgcQ family protein [Candidatus Eisenbacteria bacterium]
MTPSPFLARLPSDRPALIGVIHLEPLPGAPRVRLPLEETIRLAVRDGHAWREGGADAVLVENFGDDPFHPGPVPPETIACVTAAARAVGEATRLPLGVNVLRNDGEAALAAAIAAGGSFVRVNVLTHAYLTDQGTVEGIAHRLLRMRRSLGAETAILADLLVKHAVPLAPIDPEDAYRDLVERGGADGVIVTGRATGAPADPAFAARIASLGGAPLFVGSGITPESAASFASSVRGFLVGSWVKRDGRVDASRVRTLAEAIGAA